jgi:hypothetical protein
VTKFTLRTFPQTQVWGGYQVYGADQVPLVNAATADFVANVTDPKAGIIAATFTASGVDGVSWLYALLLLVPLRVVNWIWLTHLSHSPA